MYFCSPLCAAYFSPKKSQKFDLLYFLAVLPQKRVLPPSLSTHAFSREGRLAIGGLEFLEIFAARGVYGGLHVRPRVLDRPEVRAVGGAAFQELD